MSFWQIVWAVVLGLLILSVIVLVLECIVYVVLLFASYVAENVHPDGFFSGGDDE